MVRKQNRKQPPVSGTILFFEPKMRARLDVNAIEKSAKWSNLTQAEKCEWITRNGGGYVMAGPLVAVESNLPLRELKDCLIECAEQARIQDITMTEAWGQKFPCKEAV